MFRGTNDQQPKRKTDTREKDTSVTILTSGCHFSGKLYCRGSSRIGGKIEGQIISEGLLIVEEEAIISAEITADEAVIQGKVNGRLEATGRVQLAASCQFEGDIITPCLVIQEGARFNGNATMYKRGEARQSVKEIKPEAIPAKLDRPDSRTIAARTLEPNPITEAAI